MSWHFVERWLQKVNQHSTLLGKFWITFLIVFRIVVVSSVGDRVYSDEQSEFKCNTQQIGCPNVCFNKFSPISHIRFWSIQIIMVTTPSIVFMVYSAHKVKKKNVKEKSSNHHSPVSPEKAIKQDLEAGNLMKNCPSDEDNSKKKSKNRKSQLSDGAVAQQEPPKKSKKKDSSDDEKGYMHHYALYSFSVLLRTFVEVFFILLQYKLFGFEIPELYKCTGYPCPNIVDCFVSRPMEKTIFLWFMFVIAVISLALNIAEVYYIFWKWGMKKAKKNREKRRLKALENEMHEITIHDAELLESGAIASRNAPPDYRRLGEYEDDHMLRGVDILQGQPIAMSVSLDEAIGAAEQLKNGSPTQKFLGPSRFQDYLTSPTSLDQPYPNIKPPDRKNNRNGKKGNDHKDNYV